jgi:hypothetical protein
MIFSEDVQNAEHVVKVPEKHYGLRRLCVPVALRGYEWVSRILAP